jgi:hypothetical protein
MPWLKGSGLAGVLGLDGRDQPGALFAVEPLRLVRPVGEKP